MRAGIEEAPVGRVDGRPGTPGEIGASLGGLVASGLPVWFAPEASLRVATRIARGRSTREDDVP